MIMILEFLLGFTMKKNIKTNDRLNLLRWSAGVHLRMFLLKVQMDPQK